MKPRKVFGICWFIKKPQEIGDYTTYLGYSVTAVTVYFLAYEKWLWRKIPWNRPPVLKGKYTGTIRYNYNGVAGENPIQHGTCRMILDGDNSRISGKYWTSSNTTGDIEWVAE